MGSLPGTSCSRYSMTLYCHSMSVMPTVLRGWVNLAHIRTVGQTFLTGQLQVFPDSPKQLGLGSLSLFPHLVAIKTTIGQAQHAGAQLRQNGLSQGYFSCPVRSHPAAEQHMGAIFHQRDKSQLGKGTFPLAGAGTPKSLGIDPLVGHIQRAAVKTHQTPTPIPSPFGRLNGIGFTTSSCNLSRVCSQPGSGRDMPDLPVTLILMLGFINH